MGRTLKNILCGIVALAAGANAAPYCPAKYTSTSLTSTKTTSTSATSKTATATSTSASASATGSATARTYEAEDAVLSGTTVDTALTGFTGELPQPQHLSPPKSGPLEC